MATVGPLAFGGSDYSTNFTTDNGSFTEAAGVLDSSTFSDFNRARCTNVPMDTANHSVSATVGGRDASNNGGITARQASSTQTYYQGIYVEDYAADGYRIQKLVSGTETDLDTASAGSGAKAFVLTVDGTSLTLDVATVEVCAITDSSITSGVYAGVSVWSANGGRWDGWAAEDLAAAGTNPKGPLSNPLSGPFGGPI